MDTAHGHCIVFCTCPDQDAALRIANTLIEQSLAACVNLISNVESVYLWQGKVQTDTEVLLKIKTRMELFTQLEQQIQTLHPYELPEIIAVSIGAGSKKYLEWIDSSTQK